MSKRVIHAPRGTQISCKSWLQEAALRMLMNNLDPEVAENPDELIIYGGRGKAARNWPAYDAIVRALRDLENDETLLVQSGKPVGIFRTHPDAPRVLIANSNIVPAWATQANFDKWEREGPHHVRTDDGRKLDLYRYAGNPARNIRDVGQPGAAERLGHAPGQIRADGRVGGHGRSTAARRYDESGRGARRRGGSAARAAAAGDPVPRRVGR